jgi:hypothetical protein
MGLPKNYRKDLSITPHKQGFEQRQSILDDIANKGTYLPKGILHEDMDGEMVNYVNNDIDLVLNGEKVPVIFLTAQRWGEFTKTWKYTDIDKNIKLPFITIVRKPDAQQGTNYAGTFNIPGRPTFTYMKIPTWDGNRKGYDVYRIPQPISVDIMYEVRIFCNRMRDLNVMNRKMLTSFSALEKYIRVNGHPIPLIMESIGDESTINNLEERKYYVQLYTIKMMGYLLDEDDFVVTPAISRGINFYEISENIYRAPYQINVDDQNNTICINITFNSGVSSVTIPVDISATYTNVNATNYSSLIFKVNGSTVTIPFTVNNGDQLYIKVNKNNTQAVSEVELNGITL